MPRGVGSFLEGHFDRRLGSSAYLDEHEIARREGEARALSHAVAILCFAGADKRQPPSVLKHLDPGVPRDCHLIDPGMRRAKKRYLATVAVGRGNLLRRQEELDRLGGHECQFDSSIYPRQPHTGHAAPQFSVRKPCALEGKKARWLPWP
jgi:hypothetical protein